jgi:hypothetical protein
MRARLTLKPLDQVVYLSLPRRSGEDSPLLVASVGPAAIVRVYVRRANLQTCIIFKLCNQVGPEALYKDPKQVKCRPPTRHTVATLVWSSLTLPK